MRRRVPQASCRGQIDKLERRWAGDQRDRHDRSSSTAATSAACGRPSNGGRIEWLDGSEPVTSEKSEVSRGVDLQRLDRDEELATLGEVHGKETRGHEFGKNPAPRRTRQRPGQDRMRIRSSEISG